MIAGYNFIFWFLFSFLESIFMNELKFELHFCANIFENVSLLVKQVKDWMVGL